MNRRRGFVIALAVTAVIASAVPAAAHTGLVSSSPAAGATVESPASVSLTFNESLLDIGASLTVLDAQGRDHASGELYFPNPTTIQVDVEPLEPGDYAAQWRVVSQDGHPIEGTLPFTVVAPEPLPSPTSSVTATMEARPTPSATASTEASPTPVSTPRASDPQADSGSSLSIMIGAMIGAIILIAAAVYYSNPKDSLTGSRRRTRRP